MTQRPAHSLAEQLAAAQDWWREAGVDLDFADSPHNWIESGRAKQQGDSANPTAPTANAPPGPQVPPLGGDPASWPQTLADFAPWWLASDMLETGGAAPRIAPRGAAEPELMVLVPMPEAEDRERLLSGPQGRLIANMLAAMGIGEDGAYLAAALPRHAEHPDWMSLAERQLGKIFIHHVQLVRPKRILLLGRAMLPLFGHDPAQAGATPRQIALEGSRVPALASFGPEALFSTPRFRAGLWRGWLDWTGGEQ